MRLLLRANGQQTTITMDSAGDQVLVVGQHRYRPARIARKVRRRAATMWGDELSPALLDERLTFEALDDGRPAGPWGDSGSFSPASGAVVSLGPWDENGTVAIALHELAHELHLRRGGYHAADDVVREAVSLLAEREAGLDRSFEREPYYTAGNLIAQLAGLRAFRKLPFGERWNELMELATAAELAGLVNVYLDRSEGLGLGTWLKTYAGEAELRDRLMGKLALASLRYSLELRRRLIAGLVSCDGRTPPDQLASLLASFAARDWPDKSEELERIIALGFAPHRRPKRRLFVFD